MFQVGIRSDKLRKRSEEWLRDRKISCLQIMIKDDRLLHTIIVEPIDAAVNELARESEDRTKQSSLSRADQLCINNFIRRDSAAAVNSASSIGLLFRSGLFISLVILIEPI